MHIPCLLFAGSVATFLGMAMRNDLRETEADRANKNIRCLELINLRDLAEASYLDVRDTLRVILSRGVPPCR